MYGSTRRRHHRFGVIAAALTLAFFASAACSSGDSGDDSGDSTAPLSLYNDNPAWKDGFIETGEALKKITGRGFEPVSLPSTANYQQVVQKSLSTNKPGDIVKWSSGKLLQSLAATGNLTDLTEIWDEAVAKGWLDDSIRPAYTYDDKVWALPIVRSYWVVFYNKQVFADANLETPTTYEEFKAAAAALKANGVTPIWTGQGDGWPSFIPYQTLAGGISPDFFTQLTEDEASWDDPTSHEALSLWTEWIDNGWVTPADSKLDDAPALMKAGKLGMFPIGTWMNGALKETGMTDKDYGAFLMPAVTPGGDQAVFTEGSAWTIPKNAANHEAAMEQLANWLDPSVQSVWSAFVGDSSPNITVDSEDPVIKGVADAIEAAQPVQLNRFYESFPPNLVESATSALGGFMVNPETADEVLKGLDESAEAEWSAWKDIAP